MAGFGVEKPISSAWVVEKSLSKSFVVESSEDLLDSKNETIIMESDSGSDTHKQSKETSLNKI